MCGTQLMSWTGLLVSSLATCWHPYVEGSNPKELAVLGISSLNELACDYIPPCLQEFGFLNIIANEFGLPADLLSGGAGMPTSGNSVAIGNGAKRLSLRGSTDSL